MASFKSEYEREVYPLTDKMPRRLISSEQKQQPYNMSKSTKVPKLPSLSRSLSLSQESMSFGSVGPRKITPSSSFLNESTSSLSDSPMLSSSMTDLSRPKTCTSKKVKRRLNLDDKVPVACSSRSQTDSLDISGSPKESWTDHYKQGYGTPSTLQEQTKQFIMEALQSPTPEIDVNLIEQNLNMPKRRVYDILGVLEGIGWVKKAEKNKYVWLGEVALRMETARKRMLAVQNEMKKVDDLILKAEKYLTEMFSSDPTTEEMSQIRDNLYLTEDDLSRLEDLDKNSLIAVRTNNPSLRIEIPETKEGYELIIKSEGSPIEAYTLSPDGNFTSIADSAYNPYGNLNTDPFSQNFDPFFQDFLRSSEGDYDQSEYPYGPLSTSFEDMYTNNNFSLSELFDFGPPRISQTHV